MDQFWQSIESASIESLDAPSTVAVYLALLVVLISIGEIILRDLILAANDATKSIQKATAKKSLI